MSELIDNRGKRIRTLKHVIKHLHKGEAPEQVKAQLKELVKECDASEIAQMEQELMAEGVPVKEIMGMCDLHAEVVREVLVERPEPEIVSGHPVDTFRRENEALTKSIADMRTWLEKTYASGVDDDLIRTAERVECKTQYNALMDVDKHYSRKENLLFACLERHGITGPSKVMWGKDDETREMLKELGKAIETEMPTVTEWKEKVKAKATPALAAVEEMIFKEEKILLPMALQNLTESEWAEIWEQSPQFGWCLVEPEQDYQPPEPLMPDVAPEIAEEAERRGVAINVLHPGTSRSQALTDALIFPTGSLSLEHLKAILSTVPVDMTFVDADDRVRFFSEGPERVFLRPKTTIGRKVQHCHPPSSVDIVDRILEDFKAGRQSVAEFWINLHGKFVHIRYFALRDREDQYLGTLELTQDITKLRELEGERRLLQYD